MKVKSVREAIRGSGAEAEDFRKLDALLAEIDNAEVSEFVAAIKVPVAKVAAALAERRRATEEADAIIASIVAELERTKWDNVAFEAVVDRMKKTKAIKLGEATQIATLFLGEGKAYKTKPEAAKTILKRQISDKRSSNRQTRASDIF